MLAGCKRMLDQGRYTWRHNCILNHITKTIRDLNSGAQVISDLPGQSLSGLTIPPEVLITSDRPDLAIYRPLDKRIELAELTVPFETNLEKDHEYKCEKYANLINDINQNNYISHLTCIEIGCRGYVSPDNKMRLRSLLRSTNAKPSVKTIKNLILSVSKLNNRLSVFILPIISFTQKELPMKKDTLSSKKFLE